MSFVTESSFVAHLPTVPGGVTPGTAFVTVAALLAGYLVANGIYSLTLHPLARFPGPTWGAVTRVPFWVACINGTQVTWMNELHKRYGPVVRYGPNDLSYADEGGEAWKAIHGHEKGGREFGKAKEWFVAPANAIYGINSASAHEDHRRYRRVFAPAFSERALKAQEPLFRRHVDLLLSKLAEAATLRKHVDMVQLFQFTTFDIMGDLTFGQPLGLLESNKYSSWVQAVFDSIRVIPIAQLIQHYPILNSLFNLLEPKTVRDMKYNHFRHSADRVDLRLKRGSAEPDIWNLVLSAQDGSQLSLEEMYCHADVFMLAGSETTGTTMAGFTWFMLTHPEKLAHLKRELKTKFTREEDITMESTASLKYMNACIQEALRLYPPVPVGVPRVVPSPGRTMLGRWVAGGTRVSVHHYATYRNPANFAEPDTFAPERWLRPSAGGDKTDVYAADRREAAQPFAYGPRNCVGQNMAMHEMRLILARLFWRFDLKLQEDDGREEKMPWTAQRAFVLWEKKPLICCIQTR